MFINLPEQKISFPISSCTPYDDGIMITVEEVQQLENIKNGLFLHDIEWKSFGNVGMKIKVSNYFTSAQPVEPLYITFSLRQATTRTWCYAETYEKSDYDLEREYFEREELLNMNYASRMKVDEDNWAEVFEQELNEIFSESGADRELCFDKQADITLVFERWQNTGDVQLVRD